MHQHQEKNVELVDGESDTQPSLLARKNIEVQQKLKHAGFEVI